MSRLTAAQRAKMPAKEFANGKGSFPVNDKKHARLAIGGATRSFRAGNISKGTEQKIKAKARAKLGSGASEDHAPAGFGSLSSRPRRIKAPNTLSGRRDAARAEAYRD